MLVFKSKYDSHVNESTKVIAELNGKVAKLREELFEAQTKSVNLEKELTDLKDSLAKKKSKKSRSVKVTEKDASKLFKAMTARQLKELRQQFQQSLDSGHNGKGMARYYDKKTKTAVVGEVQSVAEMIKLIDKAIKGEILLGK
jgi:predicted  nucleic acid-binding Zn-ribbon protein